ncbi:hypothetical protein [Altererythrobacter sp.]|uniref:hypothetical protein n=1 Tax=Altererythrobacter sp. TaxID=1872480 RepID=UPI003D00F311
MGKRAVARAANDNGEHGTSDLMLNAALRHFAEHGLGAARAAREKAEAAFFAGDRESYDWWLGVCRTLDRRLAASVERDTRPRRG